MANFARAVSIGNVSGSADFGAIAAAIDGQVTLKVRHHDGLWSGTAFFDGTGSMTDDGNPSAGWSGVASTGEGGMAGTWDGDSLAFDMSINHNGIGQSGVLTLELHLDVRFGTGGAVIVDAASIRQATTSSVPVTTGFPPLAEIIDGTPGDDTLAGTNHDDLIAAGGGNDFVDARGGNDTVDGGAGSDHLEGGQGADQLYGGAGDDTVLGGDGADEIIGGSGKGDDRYNGGAGVDLLRYSSAVHAVTANLGTGRASGLDIGADRISLVEDLIGGAGADKLTGNALANVISGGAGNDVIRGNGGHDKLTGGAGADKFVYMDAPLAGDSDTIVGFAHGTDRIQLDDLAFGAVRDPGRLSVSDFTTYFDYDTDTGKLYYDADGAGGAPHVLVATLQGAPTLVAADIVVI